MSLKETISILGLCLLLICCKQDKAKQQKVAEGVSFEISFKGARLDSIQMVNENTYAAKVNPAFEPVNKSPWFAFALTAKTKGEISLILDYGKYQHRYVPKLSTDRKHWKPLEASKIKIDTLNHTATLQLEVSPQKLYVAAQEIETSDDTYAWVQKHMGEEHETQLKVAGKTALDNNNYVMVHEKEGVKNSIVIVARQHPPEIPGGTISFKRFYETLFSNTENAKKFRDNFNIYTFPLLNPDGADMGNWRHNAKGVDLNRDWVDFSQPETQTVKKFVENKVKEGKKIRFALDFHTSYSGPYILVLDSINEAKTQKIIPEWIQHIESSSQFKVEARRRSQELPYCYNYFYNTFNTEAVTYEDGDETNRDTIRLRAEVYAKSLMKILSERQENGNFTK